MRCLRGLTVPSCLAALAALAPATGLAQNDAAPATVLPQVSVIAPTPLLGSGIDRSQAPAGVSVVTGQDIARTGIPDALGTLSTQVPGAMLDNAQGNPFQPNLEYRGFSVSPLDGSPQGLAVYVNGVRFNQPFSDSVNWDLLPSLAIDTMNLEGANPVFGLNALGGSLAIQLKNGFTWHGGLGEVYGGSFGTIDGSIEYGKRSGNTAAYVAANVLHSNGWRQLNASDLHQFYGDIGWRGPRAEVHLSILAADNRLNSPGTLPVQILNADPSAVFTAPNLTTNKYGLITLSGTWYLTDATSVQGLVYYSNLSQRIRNGNAGNFEPCPTNAGALCNGDGSALIGTGGQPIQDFLNGGPYSQLNLEAVDTNGYGTALQVTHDGTLLGRTNKFVGGVSFDGGVSTFAASTLVGGVIASNGVFTGPGVTIDQPDGSVVPVRVGITNAYYGAYFADVYSLTQRLAVSLSGRLNLAQIDLHDQTGTALDGQHFYARFNPGIGLTYRLSPGLSAYASYSEANRVPTPSELSCASPQSPCTLANFFVGDPGLKQVIARTIEVGLRGRQQLARQTTLDWNADLYRTNDDDDILFVASATPGLDYFRNVGPTRRQGVELGLTLHSPRWRAWLNYAYTDATFQTALTLDSPLNPAADAAGQIHVAPGDRMPGVPAHQLKFGTSYAATPAWTVGFSGVVSSGQYLFGDEANLTQATTQYVVLDANTSYRITPALQVFALIENALNERYVTYGTFSPTTSTPNTVAPNATETRSLSPAPPIAVYIGIRATF